MRSRAFALGLVGGLFACDSILGVKDVTVGADGAPSVDASADGGPTHAGSGVVGDGGTAEGGTCTGHGCDVVDVAAGALHTCVARRDGAVFCWGENKTGQVGVTPSAADQQCGPDPCRLAPVRVAVDAVTQVAGGLAFGCSLGPAATVRCWGDNYYGQRGVDPGVALGCADAGAGCLETPTTVALPAGLAIARLSLGSATACALTGTGSGGDVYCWGSNFAGACGGVPSEKAHPPTTKVAGIDETATRVAVAGEEGGVSSATNHACAALRDRSVVCWGNNFRGQLGHATGTLGDLSGGACISSPDAFCNGTPSAVGVTGVEDIAVGSGASCALTDEGSVWCWGSNGVGLSGAGPSFDLGDHPLPQKKPLPVPMASLYMWGDSAFAVDHDGNVWAWGKSALGALGDAAIDSGAAMACENGVPCVVRPEQIPLPKRVTKVATGRAHAVVLFDDGTVSLWGASGAGQLGHAPQTAGDTTSDVGAFAPVPTAMPTLP